jgi:hypothetical protein
MQAIAKRAALKAAPKQAQPQRKLSAVQNIAGSILIAAGAGPAAGASQLSYQPSASASARLLG